MLFQPYLAGSCLLEQVELVFAEQVVNVAVVSCVPLLLSVFSIPLDTIAYHAHA